MHAYTYIFINVTCLLTGLVKTVCQSKSHVRIEWTDSLQRVMLIFFSVVMVVLVGNIYISKFESFIFSYYRCYKSMPGYVDSKCICFRLAPDFKSFSAVGIVNKPVFSKDSLERSWWEWRVWQGVCACLCSVLRAIEGWSVAACAAPSSVNWYSMSFFRK